MASSAKQKKDHVYELKTNGVAKAYTEGRLKYEGTHGRLALYRGEGYVFHCTIEPCEEERIDLPGFDEVCRVVLLGHKMVDQPRCPEPGIF